MSGIVGRCRGRPQAGRQVAAVAEVAHGGHAARAARRAARHRGHDLRVVPGGQPAHRIQAGVERQVDVGVDQAGQQGAAVEVDHRCAGQIDVGLPDGADRAVSSSRTRGCGSRVSVVPSKSRPAFRTVNVGMPWSWLS